MAAQKPPRQLLYEELINRPGGAWAWNEHGNNRDRALPRSIPPFPPPFLLSLARAWSLLLGAMLLPSSRDSEHAQSGHGCRGPGTSIAAKRNTVQTKTILTSFFVCRQACLHVPPLALRRGEPCARRKSLLSVEGVYDLRGRRGCLADERPQIYRQGQYRSV